MAASNGRELVLDHEPIVQEILEQYLNRGGFDVATASDGQGALDAYEAQRPDLIVLDLMLPGIEGLEVVGPGTPRAMKPQTHSGSRRSHSRAWSDSPGGRRGQQRPPRSGARAAIRRPSAPPPTGRA